MTRGLRLCLAGALLVILAACGRPTSPPGPVPTYRSDDLVLRMELIGGFLPVQAYLTGLPIISVYGDGRVITNGPVPAIYPGPALPNLQLNHISDADVARLVNLAVDAGVGRLTDLGQPPVADAPSTRFTVRTGAGTQVTVVNALGIGGGDGLTSAQRDGRRQLQRLSAALTDLPKTLGPAAVGSSRPYVPTAIAAVATPWHEPSVPAPPEIEWPGPTLPGEPVPTGPHVNCVTVTGIQAARLLDAAARANTATPWRSAGQRWTVALRPLLPDEASCNDLGD